MSYWFRSMLAVVPTQPLQYLSHHSPTARVAAIERRGTMDMSAARQLGAVDDQTNIGRASFTPANEENTLPV